MGHAGHLLHERGYEARRGEDVEVVAAGDLAANHAFARRRRWRGLRLEERERAQRATWLGLWSVSGLGLGLGLGLG